MDTNILHRSAALSLAALLMSSPALAAFRDTQGHWASPYIAGLNERSLIGGFPDGSFQPDRPITRAEFAVVVQRALDLKPVPGKTFKDVLAGFWAAAAIGSVSAAGLVGGFPDGSFRPNEPVTRVQALAVLAKALPEGPGSPALRWYHDALQVPAWAEPALGRAATAKLIVNTPERLQLVEPGRSATRAEVAGFIYQTLTVLKREELPPLSIGLRSPRGAVLSTVMVVPEDIDPDLPRLLPPEAEAAPATGSQQAQSDDLPRLLPPEGDMAEDIEQSVLTTAPGTIAFRPGERIRVRAVGTPRATVRFTIAGVSDKLPMEEVQPGVYEGSYTVQPGDRAEQTRVQVTLVDGNNVLSAVEPRTLEIGAG